MPDVFRLRKRWLLTSTALPHIWLRSAEIALTTITGQDVRASTARQIAAITAS